MALKDTCYLYSSSNIRARQGGSFSSNVMRLLECKSVDDIYSLVVKDSTIKGETKKEKIEAALDLRLEECFNYVMSVVPDRSVFDFLLYEYDLLNLKSLIKGDLRGVSVDGILCDLGSVRLDRLKEAVEKRIFSVLPENMARVAHEAIDSYASTQNPALIDIILDRACFADILAGAKKSGSSLILEATRTRIDTVNILTFVRIARLRCKGKAELLCDALLEGGNIKTEYLCQKIEDYDGNLVALLEGTAFQKMIESLGASPSPSLLAKALDEVYLSRLREITFIPFGAEVIYGYLVETVFEIRNIKIALATLSSGKGVSEVKERVRRGYL